jgi:hypothetical protein
MLHVQPNHRMPIHDLQLLLLHELPKHIAQLLHLPGFEINQLEKVLSVLGVLNHVVEARGAPPAFSTLLRAV